MLDKDNLDFVAGDGGLSPRLAERGIQLLRAPEFEVRYIGFNCADPKLRDPKLRRALAAAFDTAALQQHLGGLMLPVAGPLPEGVAGFDPDLVNPWQCADVEQARQWLAEAGYPDGIDPATGEPLTFTFDQGNTTSAQRQLGELFASFMERIGPDRAGIEQRAPLCAEDPAGQGADFPVFVGRGLSGCGKFFPIVLQRQHRRLQPGGIPGCGF